MEGTTPGAAVVKGDEERLAELGYKQDLNRRMSGFQNFAISFTIISILSGALTLYGTGINYGGPMQQAIGWPIVSLFVIIVALRWPSWPRRSRRPAASTGGRRASAARPGAGSPAGST